MKVLFDTSVLVAAMVYGHPDHERSFPWLEKAVQGDIQGLVAGHTLAELYAVLSSLPVRPRLSPKSVVRLLEANIIPNFTVIELTSTDYHRIITDLSALGVAGGAVYDGLIAHLAIKTGADILMTLNTKDFERLLPDRSGLIRSP